MKTIGLIGKKLGHSYSKSYYESKFRESGLEHRLCFRNFELEKCSDLPEKVLNHSSLIAFHVTIPYKKDILKFCAENSPEVQATGAANLVLVQSGRLKGFNTDVYGFRESLTRNFGKKPGPALVLGNGGASQAVQYVLRELGEEFRVVSRNPLNHNWGYTNLDEQAMAYFRLIINTTPLGMYPDTEAYPPVPYRYINAKHKLFDLIYNPSETQFLKIGTAQGAQGINGLEMLHLQADYAWKLIRYNFREL